jgi:hypothetical protein
MPPSVHNLYTQYKEQEKTNSPFDGQYHLNNWKAEETQDLNERQQTSTSRHKGSQEYDGTEARRTNLSGFEYKYNITSRNCSRILDPNCHIPSTTANVLHK